MLWNIITKNKKLSKTLPEFKRSLVPVYSVYLLHYTKLIFVTLQITQLHTFVIQT